MAYRIIDIASLNPDTYPYYFFDSNVWIAQLRGLAIGGDSKDTVYTNFFEAVISLNLVNEPKAVKKIKHQPKIIVTSLLLSEIFNAYMRQVAMKLFYYEEGKKMGLNNDAAKSDWRNYDFKRDYRQTPHFSEQFKKLKRDFLKYKNVVEFRNDPFVEADPVSLIQEISESSDFNDFLYYYTLVESGVPIVSDDGDFCFQDIEIVTANKKLLQLTR